MAIIDRNALLISVKEYLPDSNVLTDPEISKIIDLVIEFQIPADDEIYNSEALCKSLRSCAIVNRSKYSVDDAGKKREQVSAVEIEFFESGTIDPWTKYIDSLNDLCPLFGYIPNFGNSTIGIKINSGKKPDPLADCIPCKNNQYL